MEQADPTIAILNFRSLADKIVCLSVLLSKLRLGESFKIAESIPFGERASVNDEARELRKRLQAMDPTSPELTQLLEDSKMMGWLVPSEGGRVGRNSDSEFVHQPRRDTEAVLIIALELEAETPDVVLRTSQIKERLKGRFGLKPVNLAATINALAKRGALNLLGTADGSERIFELSAKGKTEASRLSEELNVAS